MQINIFPGSFFPDPGGAQVQVHNISNMLGLKKFKCNIFLLKKTNIRNAKYNIVVFNHLIIKFLFVLQYYLLIDTTKLLSLYLKKFFNIKKKNIFHFQFLNFKSLMLINAIFRFNQNIIVTFQGADIQINKKINYGNRLDIKYEKYLKFTLKKIKFFTSISNTIKKELIKIKVPENKIFYIPNAIPLKKITKIKNQINRSNNVKLITVARYSPKKKGFDLVKDLVMELNSNKINFTWYLIGNNIKKILEDFKRLNKYKKNLKLIDNVDNLSEFYLPSKKLIECYKKSDVYINLSRIESFGITFVEALASNIPIISFNTKGANEIVVNNKNGYLIKNSKIKSFVEKIKLIKKRNLNFKKFNKKYVKKYDLEKITNLHLDLYKKCY